MKPKYKEQLERLAETLYEPFRAPVQGELDFNTVCPDIEGRDVLASKRQSVKASPEQQIIRHIMQQVIAESPYKPDMEWDMWHAVRQLEEQNGLPDGVTADDVYQMYLKVFHGGDDGTL